MKFLRISVLLSLLLAAAIPGRAQRSMSEKNWFGLEVGVTGSTVMADSIYYPLHYPVLDDPSFPSPVFGMRTDSYSVGVGFLVGAVMDLSLNEQFGLQGKLQVRSHNVTSSGNSFVLCTFPDGTFNKFAPASEELSSTLTKVALSGLGRLQLDPDGLYLLGGFDIGSLISNSNEGSYTFDDEECTWRSLPLGTITGQRSFSVSEEIPDFFSSTRLGLQLGAGTWIPFGNGWALTPELLLSIPITSFTEGTSTPNVNNLAAMVENGSKGGLWWASLSIAIKMPFGERSASGAVATSNGGSNSTSSQSKTATLRGKVTDLSTGKGVDANVTVVDLNNNNVVNKGRTDAGGNYALEVPAPGRYSVTADAEGYLFGSGVFEVDENGRILRSEPNIQLPAATGRTRLLVFFDFDKDYLQPASYPSLNRAAELLKGNPNMQVEIAGYTDSKGSHAYNLDLSQRRAAAVREYLVAQGIAGSRITAKGYAEAEPIATNDTEEGRAQNRRVEFVVKKR